MKLEFIVPIFDFNYVGENISLQDMWSNSDFSDKLKTFEFEDILIRRVPSDGLTLVDDIDSLSIIDKEEISKAYWAFYFTCEEKLYEEYKRKIYLILLAFRITKMSNISVKYFLCKNNISMSIRYAEYWKYALADIENSSELNSNDLYEVRKSYLKLRSFYRTSPRTSHAIQFLYLAYASYYWMETFILFMTSLETLVSPPTEVKITSNIIKRTIKLINDSKICSKKDIKELYKLRSNIIHGRILVSLDFNERIDDLIKLQIIVLKAFEMILESDFKTNYKDENSKEKFFESICNDEPS